MGTSSKSSDYWATSNRTAPSTINDSSLTPAPFDGSGQQNAEDWLNYFTRYIGFRQLDERASLALFALLMRGAANTWYTSLSDRIRGDFDEVTAHFKEKYDPAPISRWKRASEFWSRDQRPQETVEEYYADMLRKARDVGATEADDMTRYAIMRGLRLALRTYVMQQNPTSLEALLDAAKIAEATVVESNPTVNSEILEAINRLERQVASNVNDNRRVTFANSASTGNPRSPTPLRRAGRGRIDSGNGRQQGRPLRNYGFNPNFQPRPQQAPRFQVPGCTGLCTKCGRRHMIDGYCMAKGKTCYSCGKLNHLAICCRAREQRE